MVKFSYNVAHHKVEFRASDWTGLEYLTVNGKTVSRKFNFAPKSEHMFELSNGDNCRLQLLTDASGAQTICRIYRRDEMIASLKHLTRNHLNLGLQLALIACVSCLLFYYL